MALFLQVGRQDFDYRKIQEVRRLLEVEIAAVAAERRIQEDLDALVAVLHETASVGDDKDAWLKNDMAFHALLAKATKNELFSLLLDSIADIMISVRRLGFNIPNAAARTMKYHGAILQQVQQGDPAGARAAMRVHLDEAEATMRAALEMRAKQA
jgi:GntR family transcriptional repressor for pyruvate dehydrogenase complex